MNKDRLSSLTLVISVILIVGGLIEINNPEFEPELWRAIFWFCIGIVFAVITWRLRVAVNRERAADTEVIRSQPAPQASLHDLDRRYTLRFLSMEPTGRPGRYLCEVEIEEDPR